MGGTKIFVLQMRTIIKAAVIGLLALILLIVLVFLFMPRPGANGEGGFPGAALYIPGTYTASFVLMDRPVDIRVTVNETEITHIEMTDMADSQRALFPLFEPIMARVSDDVLFYQRADIIIHNDFPVTTGILKQTVAAALEQALVD